MHIPLLLALAGTVTAAPQAQPPFPWDSSASPAYNPFLGKTYSTPSSYAAKLNQTITAFLSRNDTLNAAKTRTVQKTGTFVWIANVASLPNIATAISEARAAQRKTGKKQIVQLVLYDLPDRDCSAGASAGEFGSAADGLNKYKTLFIDPYAAALAKATDLQFAVVLEPDSLGNAVTNQGIPFCANATAVYEAGIAYAISKLQFKHVALYIDAAHGGWLGWNDNLPLAAAEFGKVVRLAQELNPKAKIRGFATDVSNFNPYIANPRANYTEWSNSYDEFHYANSLTPFLTNESLPAHFIIDQGRSGLQNTRTEWGEWCNIKAGFGIRPTTATNNTNVDSIVWIKPGGESDGPCGPTVNGVGAPNAGQWFEEYVEQLVVNADPPLAPTW